MNRLQCLVLFVLLLVAIGCGGGGGGLTSTAASIDVQWPTRSRGLNHGLSSALSATITVVGASTTGTDITFNIDRDSASVAAHTATYQVPAQVDPTRTTSVQATFYAQPGSTGDVVGTASAPVTLSGTDLRLGTITLTGVVQHVTVTSPAQMTSGSASTQLTFTATDSHGAAVAVTPGSALWAVTNGSQNLTLTADGVATPVAVGQATVKATVDGIVSSFFAIDVVSGAVPAFNFPLGKGGGLVSTGFDAVEATLFQVTGGHNIQVTQLGVEVQQTGQAPLPTAIFDAAGNILAQTTVSETDTQANGYYWKSITPLTLTAGQQYYICSLHGTGTNFSYFYDTRPTTPASFVQDLGTWFKVTSTLAGGTWQSSSGTSQYGSGPVRHYVANFQAQQL
ncbi:MAG: hypothetical protein JSS65_08880 [Armatimonadetes bacterium]|nr:hypothetical protein [Armatimonadota bacterium]